METNLGIVITLLLLASAGITFVYLLKNAPLMPHAKIEKTEDEDFMYNFLIIMSTVALIGFICATILLHGYFIYVL